jgi:hypothetical protein
VQRRNVAMAGPEQPSINAVNGAAPEFVTYETLDEGRIARFWLNRPAEHHADNAKFSDVVAARLGMPSVEYFAHPWEFGPRKAKELLLTGDSLDAHGAYRLGMVSKVFPVDELERRPWSSPVASPERPPWRRSSSRIR